MLGLPHLGVPSLTFLNRGGAVAGPKINGGTAFQLPLQFADVVITPAQMALLFTTPIALLPAPGAGYFNLPELFLVHKPAGSAYSGVAAGEDLTFRWTDGSGIEFGEIETTGFLDQTTAQTRIMKPYEVVAATLVNQIVPTVNAALVVAILTGNIVAGTGSVTFRTFYRVLPSVI